MAIAGSAMPSCRVRLIDGQLQADMWRMMHSDSIVHEPAEALKLLLATGIVFMRTTGPQWMELQRLFAASQHSAE